MEIYKIPTSYEESEEFENKSLQEHLLSIFEKYQGVEIDKDVLSKIRADINYLTYRFGISVEVGITHFGIHIDVEGDYLNSFQDTLKLHNREKNLKSLLDE